MPTTTPQYAAGDLVRWEKKLQKRDKRGADWCKEKGIGEERRWLDHALPENVIPILGEDEAQAERAMARDREAARAALRSICKTCKRCELGW
jgi:hypothetical protein